MSGADRGTWRLIARRDFWVRLRERSFLISTLLNVGVISVLILARAAGGGDQPSFDLGVVGTGAIVSAVFRAYGQLAVGLAIAFGVGLLVMLFGAALAGRLQPASHGGSARALR